LKMLPGEEIVVPEEVQVDEELYDSYKKLLAKTPFKVATNKSVRRNVPDPNVVTDTYFQNFNHFTPEFHQGVKKVITDGIEVVRTSGPIPYNYIPMLGSPRILPKNSSKTINGAKVVIREAIYQAIADTQPSYVVIDFDLKSCYTSILLGLYPEQLEAIQRPIEGVGLWNFIKQEYIANGKEAKFDKFAVKA